MALLRPSAHARRRGTDAPALVAANVQIAGQPVVPLHTLLRRLHPGEGSLTYVNADEPTAAPPV